MKHQVRAMMLAGIAAPLLPASPAIAGPGVEIAAASKNHGWWVRPSSDALKIARVGRHSCYEGRTVAMNGDCRQKPIVVDMSTQIRSGSDVGLRAMPSAVGSANLTGPYFPARFQPTWRVDRS